MNTKPTIALCIMVKNEEKTLPRLLASVQGFADKIIALDTGSTDKTLDILRLMGAEVIELPFVDFGTSRTQLMEFAKGKADWLLLLDADMTLHFDPVALRAAYYNALHKDVTCYSLEHGDGYSYWVTRIVRGDLYWKYKGATHEYLEKTEKPTRLLGAKVKHHADGGSRADKFARDRRLLSTEFKADPANGRALFYLASTERDMGLLNSALAHYQQRAKMGGWEEERWMAQLYAAQISLDPLALTEAWLARPHRAEALYWLERAYLGRGLESQALGANTLRSAITYPPQEDILFVDKVAYDPKLAAPFYPWQSIPGWFDYESVYRKFVGLIPDGGKFTEVGTWLGRSFAAFDAFAKQEGKTIYKTAVDTFLGTATEPEEAKAGALYGSEFEQEFHENMARCDVTDVEVRAKTSAEAAAEKVDGSQDVVFIDGDHTYEGVVADIKAWAPKVKKNGVLAGHDFDRPEVRRAVLQFFAESDVRVEGRCWITSPDRRLSGTDSILVSPE